MKEAYGLRIPETLEEVCDPQRVALLCLRHAGWNPRSDQKPGANHAASSQSVERLQRRGSASVLVATPVTTKRIDGDVSLPDGYDLATQGLARTSGSVVLA